MNATEPAGVYFCTRHAGICNEDSDRCDFAGSNPKDPELGDVDICVNCDEEIEYVNDGGDDDYWAHTATTLSQCTGNDPGGVYAEPTDLCILAACYYDPAEAAIRK